MCCQSYAQPSISENYYYRKYCYIDNLPEQISSGVIDSLYYSGCSRNNIVLYKDDNQQLYVFVVYSNKAKDGYLYVNECIRDYYINMLKCCYDNIAEKLNITYVYNNSTINTKNDVMRLVRLKKKRINSPEIVMDKQNNTITVYITTK